MTSGEIAVGSYSFIQWRKILLLAFQGTFFIYYSQFGPKLLISLPFHILELVKYLPFHTHEA